MQRSQARDSERAHRDPLTGAPGAHPLGTGAGAVAGGVAASAAAGALLGGPAGAVAGAAAGALLGGLAGKAVAEYVDPTEVDEYWQGRYQDEPYYQHGRSYEEYAPAYQLGVISRRKYSRGEFEDNEAAIERDYRIARGSSTLEWQHARPAARASFYLIGDNDHM